MDLANVPERTLSVCEKKGDIVRVKTQYGFYLYAYVT